MPSLLPGAFRGLAPLQTTDLDQILPFFCCSKNGIWLRRCDSDTPVVQLAALGFFQPCVAKSLVGDVSGRCALTNNLFGSNIAVFLLL